MIVQDQLIGKRFEKCLVEKLIGRGGYGLTFLAFDEELQEHRVIKISQVQGLDENGRQRHLKSFLEEGLILSRLKHPQIVTLRGQGDNQGQRYMILDFIQGYSLRQVIDAVSQKQLELGCEWQDLMDPVTATALILSALYPLEYAHRANVHLPDREIFGVAHRDISPGNLILGTKGNEKGKLILIDFGTAKTQLNESITVDHNLVGTVPYMGKARLQKANSTEQMHEHFSFWKDFKETQHDIHALGVLYFQLLTGRLPFAGESSPQIIVNILDPESYSRSHLEIASAFPFASRVLRKCLVYHDFSHPLAEHPYQFPDAAAMLPELVHAFDQFSNGQSVKDVLTKLSGHLAHPESWMPLNERTVNTSSFSRNGASHPLDAAQQKSINGTSKKPAKNFAKNPSPRKNRTGIYVTLIIILLLGLISIIGLVATTGISGLNNFFFTPKVPILKSTSLPPNKPTAQPLLEKLDTPPASVTATETSPIAVSKAHTSVKTLPHNQTTKKNGVGKKDLAEAFIQTPSTVPPVSHASAPTATRTPAVDHAISNSVTAAFSKEDFVQLQTSVREEDPSAYQKITAALQKYPNNPDLQLLKSQLILQTNPASTEARSSLKNLTGQSPQFIHPALFHETTLYLLFFVDAAIYESAKSPTNRMNMQKSGNIYLAEYQPNPAFAGKVKRIIEQLSK